ncbi:origin of replication complex subunit 4 isoform X5 [Amborella trichopoda]|uniref:origin of replication complex subunit 4 isoform X5 n=1 Tax=Amborella trichopoda TaxID=13333 RepID=UPI0009BE311A|nr:origin of replication complex subunit 4 isoform X5 [Amborella trichopoda]|eukprot:XP_020522691.1 origin of replication complex subunit 4 isoform X5 [Amborella trichopoda]
MSTGAAADAQALLRCRLSDPRFSLSPSPSPDSNYSKLKFILSNSIFESCNNSVLLLGPRGCGKTTVLELVLRKLQTDHPDRLSVVRLNGLLHSDDRCALKEIVRQLCTDHQLIFSKMASCDDNSQFMLSMLRECALAHKAIIFVLDEFDLFTPGKQRLLYSLLDAMQSVQSQAVVVGVSCRLDADQLLEKRVRSRFSHRKLLFLPPSMEDLQRLLRQILFLPTDSSFRHSDFAVKFNAKLSVIFNDSVQCAIWILDLDFSPLGASSLRCYQSKDNSSLKVFKHHDDIFEEILLFTSAFTIILCHVYREANSDVDQLAKEGQLQLPNGDLGPPSLLHPFESFFPLHLFGFLPLTGIVYGGPQVSPLLL